MTGLLHGLLGTGVNFDIPLGLIYGGFLVIGHEMFHGFDDFGSLFDKEGMRFNWWRPKEAKIYEERIKCLVRTPLFLGIKTSHLQVSQYQNFSIPYDGKEYSITLQAVPSENIADNGGTRAVYGAYQRLPEEEKGCIPGFNFTSDQLFWVAIFKKIF